MDFQVINQRRTFPHRRGYRIAKRVMDMIACLLIIPLALPMIAFCALAILLDSRGPAFFVQERIGRGGRPFRMYKFRTMEYNLDENSHRTFMRSFVKGVVGGNTAWGDDNSHSVFKRSLVENEAESSSDAVKVFKPAQPSQITRIGRILRRTSLDELPQLFNVLKGEMSLVGPRPNVLWEVEEYRSWHNERLEVLPGITGLAQVHGRSGICFDNIVEYDIEYIESMNLLLDLKVLWWTISSVFTGQGVG